MITGIAALSLASKVQIHRKIGVVFFYGMLTVFITALIMGIYGSLQFLLNIAVLSFFSTFHGVRSMQFFKGKKPGLIDWVSTSALTAAGLYLLTIGLIAGLSSNFSSGVILYLVYGALMLVLSLGAFR